MFLVYMNDLNSRNGSSPVKGIDTLLVLRTHSAHKSRNGICPPKGIDTNLWSPKIAVGYFRRNDVSPSKKIIAQTAIWQSGLLYFVILFISLPQ